MPIEDKATCCPRFNTFFISALEGQLVEMSAALMGWRFYLYRYVTKIVTVMLYTLNVRDDANQDKVLTANQGKVLTVRTLSA